MGLSKCTRNIRTLRSLVNAHPKKCDLAKENSGNQGDRIPILWRVSCVPLENPDYSPTYGANYSEHRPLVIEGHGENCSRTDLQSIPAERENWGQNHR